MSEDQEISCSVIDSHVSESNSNVPSQREDINTVDQNVTIIDQQTHIGTNQNFSYDINSSNDPEVKEAIEKFIYEAAIDAIERLKNKSDRTDGIPNDVLDYLRSKCNKNRNTKGSDKNTNEDAQRNNVQLVSVDTKDIPLDKVDVVNGDNYTTLNVKKGFGISQLTEANELIWESNESSKYAKKVHLYNEGEKYLAFLLLNDMSLVSLERTGYNTSWKIVPNKFNSKNLNLFRKIGSETTSYIFPIDYHERFLIIFMPYPSKRITYNESLVFKDNDDGNYALFLSVDLLTGQMTVQLYQLKVNHYLAQFQLGHKLSVVQKLRGKDISILGNIELSMLGPKETDEGTTGCDKLTSESLEFIKKSSKHIVYFALESCKLKSAFKLIMKILKVIKFDKNGNKNINIVEVNINQRDSKYYITKGDVKFNHYIPNEHVLFDKVLDGKKVIWKKKKNGLLAKEVYFYFDDNDKWVIILLDNNTLKFYHKQPNSKKWTGVSTKMISTDILKVINKNSRKQSRKDFMFDFFRSLCLIDLGNAVSVGYKDYVQCFKEFGIEHSVWLMFDILTKSVHFMEVILKTQNQLTNQH